MANYIFLDVDGVLNNYNWLLKTYHDKDSAIAWDLDPKCVYWLADLCKNCNAKIVLSSSWRSSIGDDLQVLPRIKELEEQQGYTGHTSLLLRTFKENNIELVGKTDNDRPEDENDFWDRAGQIYRYILHNITRGDQFIILDDEDVPGLGAPKYKNVLQDRFLLTDFYGDGLNEEIVKKAKKLFTN